jgi:hypothetical protein
MFDFQSQSRRATACKALVALIGATAGLAAVAYAASSAPKPGAAREPAGASPSAIAPGPESRQGKPRPLRPRIARHPRPGSLSSRVGFRYVSRLPQASFQCKLDDAAWKRCGTRISYRGLSAGPHLFGVRVEGQGGGLSLPARFAWVRTQPKGFAIEPELAGLAHLFPGAPPVTLPIVVRNPNPAPITVTALRVSVTADPAGCPSASNLELIQSSVSPRTPLKIPADAAVRLPAPGIAPPALALRDLSVNQDACQGAQFPLAFSGEAQG